MNPDLLEAGLPATVRAELDRRGIEIKEVAAVIDDADTEVVALTGSYATGEANQTSDLDFTVVTARPAARRIAGAANHPSIFGDSFDVRVRSLLVNIEYVAEDGLDSVCAIIDAARSQAGSPDLPNFQALELRLVQRLASGLAITGGEQLERYRSRLDVQTARASAVALAFVGALSLLEDAQVFGPPARELMHRSAGEALLLAAVNAFGPITYDVKHLCKRAIRLAGQPGAARAFTDLERMLFVDRLAPADATALLLDIAVDLKDRLSDDRCPPLAGPMLVPFADSWAWTGRRFL
jgi:predicted nucleotidyltransferase